MAGLRQGGNRYYYIFDGMGSVVGLANSSGTVINTYYYDPYGVILSQSETIAQPFKFAGVYYDNEYDLHKMGARYYDQTKGRFTQADPIAMQSPMVNGGQPWLIGLCKADLDGVGALAHAAFNVIELNFFAYASNDPVNGLDPTGYWNWKNFWKTLEKIYVTVETVCTIGLFVLAVGVALVSLLAGLAVTAGIFLVPAAGGAI